MSAPECCAADFLPPARKDDPVPRMIEGALAELARSGHPARAIDVAIAVDTAMRLADVIPKDCTP